MASSNNDYSIGGQPGPVAAQSNGMRGGVLHLMRTIEGEGHTDVGLVRKRNEDAFHVDPRLGFAVVADGMGGAPAGELASSLAVTAVVDTFTASPLTEAPSQNDLNELCGDAVRAAERAVTAEGAANPVNRGLGCTLTVLLLDPSRERFAMAHVGDSRAYRIRDRHLEQLSRDHTLAQESVDEGRLPPDAVRHHPFGHILTRVIGMERPVDVQVESGVVHPGDGFLLCTDGVVRVLEESEIEDILERSADMKASVTQIIESANDRGGPDNSTVVLLDIREGSQATR